MLTTSEFEEKIQMWFPFSTHSVPFNMSPLTGKPFHCGCGETHLYNNYLFFILFINVQIVLGIFVLISGANIYLASMHQISSIFLVLIALSLYHRTISM